MKLYDFSLYAERREEIQAARMVKEAVSHIENPGTIHFLKMSVSTWMDLHRRVLAKKIKETEAQDGCEVLENLQRFAP